MASFFSLLESNPKIRSILEYQNKKRITKIKIKQAIFVVNPNVSALPYHDAIIEAEKKLFEDQKEDYYFCREDVFDDLKEVLYPSKDYNKLLCEIHGHIPNQDYGALYYAANICKEENEGRNAKSQLRNLYLSYRQRGMTLYNWLRCQDVFKEDIFPYLKYVKKHYPAETVTQIFSLYWELLIKEHHRRIFINKNMAQDDLKDAILKRLLIYGLDKISIYGRRTRIGFGERIIKRLMKEDLTGFKLKEKPYKLGTSNAKTFIISSK